MQKNSVFRAASFGVNPLMVNFDMTLTEIVTLSSFDSTFFLKIDVLVFERSREIKKNMLSKLLIATI